MSRRVFRMVVMSLRYSHCPRLFPQPGPGCKNRSRADAETQCACSGLSDSSNQSRLGGLKETGTKILNNLQRHRTKKSCIICFFLLNEWQQQLIDYQNCSSYVFCWLTNPLMVTTIIDIVLWCSWIFSSLIIFPCVFPSNFVIFDNQSAQEFISPKWIISTIQSFISPGYPFTLVLHKAQDHRVGPERKPEQYHTALHATEKRKRSMSVSLSPALLGVCVHLLLCSPQY